MRPRRRSGLDGYESDEECNVLVVAPNARSMTNHFLRGVGDGCVGEREMYSVCGEFIEAVKDLLRRVEKDLRVGIKDARGLYRDL